MKHENPITPVVKDGVEYHSGWLYTQKTLDSILGNQLAIIEAIGLTEKQEEAVKSQLRQALFRPTRLAMFFSSQEVADRGREKGDERHPIAHDTITVID